MLLNIIMDSLQEKVQIQLIEMRKKTKTGPDIGTYKLRFCDAEQFERADTVILDILNAL